MILTQKSFLKDTLSLVALGAFALLFAASGSVKKVPETPRYVAKFDYTAPNKATEKCGVTFALVKPKFAKAFEYSGVSPFSDFAQNMGTDYEELLTAKGYSIRGPFTSRDEMVFNDKDQSNLLIEPTIDISINTSGLKVSSMPGAQQGVGGYQASGQIVLTGQFSFYLFSPKRNEKVWVKTMPLDNKVVTIVSKKRYDNSPTIIDLMREDVNVYNEVAKALEAYYPAALDLGWKYLEPSEMKQFSIDAKKADSGN